MRFLFTIILLVGSSFFNKSVQGEKGTIEPYYLKSNESKAFFAAIEAGETDVVKSLIENGTNINAGNKYELSFVQYAVIRDKTDIVKILLEHGANLTITHDICSNSALHWAAVIGNVEIAKLLLEHGAKVNEKNNLRKTPLGMAAGFGNKQIVELLINHGAEVNYMSYKTMGPFQFAAMNVSGSLEIWKILISNGANTSEHQMSFALDVAAFYGTKEMAEYLIEMGANVNANIEGSSILHSAFRTGNEEVKKVLIEHGADLNAKDKNNKTPSEMDSEEGRKKRAEMLARMKGFREGELLSSTCF